MNILKIVGIVVPFLLLCLGFLIKPKYKTVGNVLMIVAAFIFAIQAVGDFYGLF